MSNIKLLPLGGMATVTKNLYVYEYENQRLIVDCGIGFPDPTMLGIDILIPDISYLQDKIETVQAIILTHAHEDHIGGLPYILPQLPTNLPIYGSELTLGFVHAKLKEFSLEANLQKLPKNQFKLGHFTVDCVDVTHSVPDTKHLAISTPNGQTIYHGSDFKFDFTPVDGKRSDLQKIAAIGRKGVTALLSDSLNSESATFSSSEASLYPKIKQEIETTIGTCFISVISSNIHRIQQIITAAQKCNRQVALIGRSIEQNVDVAIRLGYLKKPSNLISKKKIKNIKRNKLVVIIAGSQGQTSSSLVRAAEGQHAIVSIRPNDKVIIAAEPIPGNEFDVYQTIDTLSAAGAEVIYSDIANIHVSGHSSKIEQQLLIELLKPKHVIPIGGTYHHMIEYQKLAKELGYKDNQIHLLENGECIEFDQNSARITDKIKLKNIMVDGLGVGDVGHVVLRDRQRMSEDGMLVVIVPIDHQSGQVSGNIEIISRGLVYEKQSQKFLDELNRTVIDCLKPSQHAVTNWPQLRIAIESAVETQVYELINRRPLVLTVLIET